MPYDTGRRDKEGILKVKRDRKEKVIHLMTSSIEEVYLARINIERYDGQDPHDIMGLRSSPCKRITIPIRRVLLRSFLNEGIT